MERTTRKLKEISNPSALMRRITDSDEICHTPTARKNIEKQQSVANNRLANKLYQIKKKSNINCNHDEDDNGYDAAKSITFIPKYITGFVSYK